MHRYSNSPCNSLILCVLCCWCGNIYKLKNNRIFVLKLRIFRCFRSNRCVVSIHLMNFSFLFFTSEHRFDSQLRYSDIFYFMFSTFVQTKVRPKKSGTDEGQRHLLMYGEIEECIPCEQTRAPPFDLRIGPIVQLPYVSPTVLMNKIF